MAVGWWEVSRANPRSVLWVRYEDLLATPLEQVRQVARFVRPAAARNEELLERIVVASSFGEMKQRHEADPANASLRNSGETSHFSKGKAGDWRDHMSREQRVRFAAMMRRRLQGTGLEEAFEVDDAVEKASSNVT